MALNIQSKEKNIKTFKKKKKKKNKSHIKAEPSQYTHEKMFYKLQETTDTNLDYYIQQNYQ